MSKIGYGADLDGSLLNEKGEITPHSEKVIKEFRVDIITARSDAHVEHFLEQFNSEIIILDNGGFALNKDGKEVLHKEIPKEKVMQIKNIVEQQGLRFHVTAKRILYHQKGDMARLQGRFFPGQPYTKKYTATIGAKWPQGIQKICVEIDTLEQQLQLEFLCQELELNPFFSGEHISGNEQKRYRQVDIGQTSKLEAANALLLHRYYRYVYFGDGVSDLVMTANPKVHFVAMCNAKDNIKMHAHEVTRNDNNSDGIARYLESI